MQQQYTRILRLPEVLKLTGLSRSTLYKRRAEYLIPPAISLGGNSVGWPENEIVHIVNCRISGKTDDEIRKVVFEMLQRRANASEIPHFTSGTALHMSSH